MFSSRYAFTRLIKSSFFPCKLSSGSGRPGNAHTPRHLPVGFQANLSAVQDRRQRVLPQYEFTVNLLLNGGMHALGEDLLAASGTWYSSENGTAKMPQKLR